MINLFNDVDIINFYMNKSLWKGCFGGMSVITHDFLTIVSKKYDIDKLLDVVLTRYNRSSFERVIGCILEKEHQSCIILNNASNKSIYAYISGGNISNKEYYSDTFFGDICSYVKWGIKFNEINDHLNLPIIKVWTGR
jgi:hypothetical protein